MDSGISETSLKNCNFERGSLESAEFHSCDFIYLIFSDVGPIFTRIGDSKFSKFNKSIKFEGTFFLSDILDSKIQNEFNLYKNLFY